MLRGYRDMCTAPELSRGKWIKPCIVMLICVSWTDVDRLQVQAFAGIVTVSVGHCHPKVVDAVKRQSELLQHTTTIYLNPQIALYAKELTDRLPGNLKVSIADCYMGVKLAKATSANLSKVSPAKAKILSGRLYLTRKKSTYNARCACKHLSLAT